MLLSFPKHPTPAAVERAKDGCSQSADQAIRPACLQEQCPGWMAERHSVPDRFYSFTNDNVDMNPIPARTR
ncbi:hypothetical protein GCM10011348_42560 [Marinobacterium nitratireducens]|uniref:Uncharacterized protein n=1 Tax=Marinobacterium nitratireducens TaxID=518897 RepID=A0A918DY71_9GAMM|nr:hypothetical protein GCM10011348_42560 [Marinobacterium nitratireducens]